MIEHLGADDLFRIGIAYEMMVCGRAPDHGECLELLHRGIVGMEAPAVEIAHGLQLQGVVEAAEHGVVIVAHDQEDLGPSHLPVHEVADIRSDLLEVGCEVAEPVDYDNDLLLPAYLLDTGEQVEKIRDPLLLAAEYAQSTVDLLQIVGTEARCACDVDVVLVLHELAQERGLAQMTASAYGARHGHLVPQVVEEGQLLRTSYTSIHDIMYAL